MAYLCYTIYVFMSEIHHTVCDGNLNLGLLTIKSCIAASVSSLPKQIHFKRHIFLHLRNADEISQI